MIVTTLHALAIACVLTCHDAPPVDVTEAIAAPVLVMSQGDEETELCATKGRVSARNKRGADPPLSDVTGITLIEPPETGSGMDGPLNKQLAPGMRCQL